MKQFLVERGFLENTPTAIAAFITRYCSDLDKTQTGDYLGEGKDFNIKILHIFVDSNDFMLVELGGKGKNRWGFAARTCAFCF